MVHADVLRRQLMGTPSLVAKAKSRKVTALHDQALNQVIGKTLTALSKIPRVESTERSEALAFALQHAADGSNLTETKDKMNENLAAWQRQVETLNVQRVDTLIENVTKEAHHARKLNDECHDLLLKDGVVQQEREKSSLRI